MILNGDSLSQLKQFPDNYFHSVVTDPPYGLSFMGKKWDYDVPSVELWKEVLRVLKPGGHLLSFGGTRTYHRMVVNIEDAGFEIRDQLQWIYGSGFPKSHDISKAIDKAAGAEREVVGERKGGAGKLMEERPWNQSDEYDKTIKITAPATDAAKKWAGWGSALKPANEPIVMARKPIEGTLAQNTLKHGCGGLNIDATRVATTDKLQKLEGSFSFSGSGGANEKGKKIEFVDAGLGRFPANIIFDEDAAESLGEPSRFFYVAKASKAERNAGLEGMPVRKLEDHASGTKRKLVAQAEGPKNPNLPRANHHPTVKPIKLMQYLIKLVTPQGGIVLDPFCGSGTTGVAAKSLDFGFVGIEREAEYVVIAEKRIEGAA